MKRPIPTLITTLATSIAVLGAGARLASANEHVLVVLDTTGSMTRDSIPGLTRLEVAKRRLTAFLDTMPSVTSEYALWYFGGTTYTPIYTFADHKTRADLKARIMTATTGGATPLAHTVCAAVNELVDYLPDEFHTKRIVLETDGEENNTPMMDPCWGLASVTPYPTLTMDSWQWKVRNMACTGDPTLPGPCTASAPPFTLIVDVDLLFDFIPLTLTAREAVNPEPGAHTLGALAAAAPSSVNDDSVFFAGLAKETRGRYTGITPETPPAIATPIAGDANGDGCVNIKDRALVLQQFGTPGTNADFNHDGIVNTFDLQTVLQNFGRGCVP